MSCTAGGMTVQSGRGSPLSGSSTWKGNTRPTTKAVNQTQLDEDYAIGHAPISQ